jgi:transforming growth factor-beta-induced protein
MRLLSKHYVLALFAASIFMVSCNDDDDDDDPQTPSGPTQNIAEIASSNPEYSILVEALTAANLVGAVSDENATLTVFAPNNNAFNSLFDDLDLVDDNGNGSRVDELVNELGATEVTNILLYHVLGTEIRSGDVPEKGYVTTLSTGSPDSDPLSLLVESRSDGVFMNNEAEVNAADILATNGVIHGIDRVLLLPTVADHAINNPGDFSALVGAVLQVGLEGSLDDENAELTVFAPLNSAFEDVATTVAGLTDEQLETVLLYHVLGSQVRAEDVPNGSVETLNTQSIFINVSESAVTISDVDESNEDATVVLTNVQGRNGVVHVIDVVLIPQL